MNFILQTIDEKVTLDMCFQMERAKEYWDWKDADDSFKLRYCDLKHIECFDSKFSLENCFNGIFDKDFNPEEWCPVGTVEFVEKYLRTYFGDEIADNAMKPLNVPDCFLDNCRFECGRYIWNTNLEDGFDETDDNTTYFIKDNQRIKNPNNGIMTLKEAYDKGLRNAQVSTLIRDNSSEWRVFIHNGKAVDIKHYSGAPFVFPNKYTIVNCYVPKLDFNEGTIDVYVDLDDNETYVMECHKFFSCGLYGFNQLNILPLMYWRTYKELIK